MLDGNVSLRDVNLRLKGGDLDDRLRDDVPCDTQGDDIRDGVRDRLRVGQWARLRVWVRTELFDLSPGALVKVVKRGDDSSVWVRYQVTDHCGIRVSVSLVDLEYPVSYRERQ